ncbi:hypothetical protein IJ818_00655 [bacterium]|nr:hypothetical protein [bacterium]
MYPNLNVNGVGGTNGSHRSGSTNGRSEQDPRDIDIFGGGSDDDISESSSMQFIKNTKKAAEEASQKTQSHMERIKYYVDQGYTYAQAIQAVEDEEGGPVTRAQLVQRLIAQGYDPETAESLIPQNVDQRIDYAREQGRAEGQRRIQEFDQQLNNIRNGRR